MKNGEDLDEEKRVSIAITGILFLWVLYIINNLIK